MSQEETKLCMIRMLPEELQAEAVRVAIEENPDNMPEKSDASSGNEMAAITGKLWRPGRTVRVGFLDGPRSVQSKVEKYAHQWEQYANIRFEFGPVANAEIRISFKLKGSWSYIGTDALLVDKNEPTMNYGWLREHTEDIEYSRVVLHEFGHALGLLHEHQSPNANIPWDKDAVYRKFMGPPNNWTKEEIDNNLFNRISPAMTRATPFDPNSIMIYGITDDLTIGNFEVKGNSVLSEMDKAFIRRLYPGIAHEERPLVAPGVENRAAQPEQ